MEVAVNVTPPETERVVNPDPPIDFERSVLLARRVKFPIDFDASKYAVLICDAFKSLPRREMAEVMHAINNSYPERNFIEQLRSFDRDSSSKFTMLMSLKDKQSVDIVVAKNDIIFRGSRIFVHAATVSRKIALVVQEVLEDSELPAIKEVLRQYGTIRSSNRLKHTHGWLAEQNVLTCRFKVVLNLHPGVTPASIPQVLNLNEMEYPIYVPQTEQRCYRCDQPGHVVKDCTAVKCSSCKTYHPDDQPCPVLEPEVAVVLPTPSVSLPGSSVSEAAGTSEAQASGDGKKKKKKKSKKKKKDANGSQAVEENTNETN